MSNSVARKAALGTLGAVALAATLFTPGSQAQERPEGEGTTTPSSATGASPGAAELRLAEEKAALLQAALEERAAERAAEERRAAERRAAKERAAERRAAEEAAREAARLAEITLGEQGEHVARMQERLRRLGYQISSVDGAYGGETWQAVLALQKVAGLGRDAVAGPATLKALENGVVPVSRYGGTGIEVDLTRQVLLVVENGRVIRTINASSGNGERYEARGNWYVASTPAGSFGVYKQIDGYRESSLDLGSMYRPKYFTGGIAVHGSPSIPGYPASHGCVRVSNAAMDWIWAWGAGPGTPVHVYH
ncbi:L,D-transpeptidase family protein [Myceligenerans crystallogenes]|uniref:L,D-TPase catalytic domain-containing protein n=1 Tax=Myceligenerans crystallogenes TaxID=316335 RepID=A0ABP4ZDN8_9MICO